MSESSPTPSPAPRLEAIDRLRGLVMVLMCSDHAAHVFYADSIMRDSAFMRGWDRPLPAVPFLFRWASHLCAPTFVFLAGAALALAAVRRAGRKGFDRDLALRGLLLIAIELTFISFVWGRSFEAGWIFQVLWALGSSMLLMVALRRLSVVAAVLLSCLVLGFHEWPMMSASGARPGFAAALLYSGGFGSGYVSVYPTLPWLAVMLLGHAFGRGLASGAVGAGRTALLGVGALAVWCVVKLADGYGNVGMRGVHDGWLRWLQCSKYPPSLAFVGLELGLALLLLAAFAARRTTDVLGRGLLLALGRAALLFYVGHIALLEGCGALLRLVHGDAVAGGLGRTLIATALTVLVLWPVCLWFAALRRRHPEGWLRLI